MAFNAGDLVNFFFVYRSGGATGRRLVWLKIVGTGKIISEEESMSIYLSKKQEENKSIKDILSTIYRQANVNYLEIISEINWEEEDYE